MNDRDPFGGTLEFDAEAWHRAGCPTLESLFVRWQAAEQRANAAEAELRETAGELAETRAKLEKLSVCFTDLLREKMSGTPAERKVLDAMAALSLSELRRHKPTKGSPTVALPCRAELARRGEKP